LRAPSQAFAAPSQGNPGQKDTVMRANVAPLPKPEFRPAFAPAASSGPRPLFASSSNYVSLVQSYDAGQSLYAIGDRSDCVLEIVTGAVLVSRLLGDGRRQVVDIVGPGRLFGFDFNGKRDCAAEALRSTKVYRFDLSEAERRPAFSERISKAMAEEIQRLRDLATLLGRKSARERVASFLCTALEDMPNDGVILHLPVTRGEIGDHLGLTLETVSRTFSQLRRERLIAAGRRDEIEVLNYPGLLKLARGA
jgi:CRP-like cAMP-binding protein